MPEVDHPHERLLASALLMEAAGRGSANVDRFSGWLLAGYAGAATLLLTNAQSLIPIFRFDPLPGAIYVLVAVLALSIVQKMIAVGVAGAAGAAPLGRQMAADLMARDIEIDVAVFAKEIEKAVIPPMRWFVSRSFKKAQDGDLAAAARNVSKFSQVQALLVLAQTILVLSQIWRIGRSVAL